MLGVDRCWQWALRATGLIALGAALAGCGGSDAAPPAAPQPDGSANAQALRDLSGLYISNQAQVVIDPNGQLVGTYAAYDASLAERPVFVVFSGTVTATGSQWGGQAIEVGQSAGAVLVTSTATATLQGSFARGGSLTFTLAGPAVSPRIPQAVTVPLRNDVTETASLQAIGGSYTAQISAGIPESTSSFVPDSSIDPATGEIRAVIELNCSFTGKVQVSASSRNIYRVGGTMAGTGCKGRPGKVYELLAYKQRPSPPTSLVMIGNIEGQIGLYGLARP